MYDRYLLNGWPWSANIAITGCLLIYMGILLRILIEKYRVLSYNRILLLLFSLVSLILAFMIARLQFGMDVNMAYASYGVFPLFFINLLFMSISILTLSRCIDNKWLSINGRYTLPIYAFHLLVMGVVIVFVEKCGVIIGDQILKGVLVSVATLVITTVGVYPLKKYVPNLVGIF